MSTKHSLEADYAVVQRELRKYYDHLQKTYFRNPKTTEHAFELAQRKLQLVNELIVYMQDQKPSLEVFRYVQQKMTESKDLFKEHQTPQGNSLWRNLMAFIQRITKPTSQKMMESVEKTLNKKQNSSAEPMVTELSPSFATQLEEELTSVRLTRASTSSQSLSSESEPTQLEEEKYEYEQELTPGELVALGIEELKKQMDEIDDIPLVSYKEYKKEQAGIAERARDLLASALTKTQHSKPNPEKEDDVAPLSTPRPR